jgi:hypothetical protein
MSQAQNVLGFNNWPNLQLVNNAWGVQRTGNTRNLVDVGFGEEVRVRFQVVGAYNSLVSGSNRTRNYTVTIRRGPQSYRELENHFISRINGAGSRAQVETISLEAITAFVWYRGNQSGSQATLDVMNRYLDRVLNHADARWSQLAN